MSKFDRITFFISVVDEHGFAAAARKTGVSTAAVSRQVTALENELGIQLLHRTTRQISLTDVGKNYYLQCKKILGELEQAETEMAASKKIFNININAASARPNIS